MNPPGSSESVEHGSTAAALSKPTGQRSSWIGAMLAQTVSSSEVGLVSQRYRREILKNRLFYMGRSWYH
jgi:hypothetical protein